MCGSFSPFFVPKWLSSSSSSTSGGLASIDGSAVWYGKTSGDLDIDRLPWFGTSCNMFIKDQSGIEELQQEKKSCVIDGSGHWVFFYHLPFKVWSPVRVPATAAYACRLLAHMKRTISSTWGWSMSEPHWKNVRSLETSLDLRITS